MFNFFELFFFCAQTEPKQNVYQPTSSLLATDKYKDRLKSIHGTVKMALESASCDVWNCRVNQEIYDSRFRFLLRFLEGYIDNEINLNEDSSCGKICNDYTKTKHFHCADRTMCADPNPSHALNGLREENVICDGIIRDCRDIDVDGDIEVHFGVVDVGRYNYIGFNNGSSGYGYPHLKSIYNFLNLTVITCISSVNPNNFNCFSLVGTHLVSRIQQMQ